MILVGEPVAETNRCVTVPAYPAFVALAALPFDPVILFEAVIEVSKA